MGIEITQKARLFAAAKTQRRLIHCFVRCSVRFGTETEAVHRREKRNVAGTLPFSLFGLFFAHSRHASRTKAHQDAFRRWEYKAAGRIGKASPSAASAAGEWIRTER